MEELINVMFFVLGCFVTYFSMSELMMAWGCFVLLIVAFG
jgi:hypothetical protein